MVIRREFQSTPDSLLPGDVRFLRPMNYPNCFNPLPTAYCRETAIPSDYSGSNQVSIHSRQLTAGRQGRLTVSVAFKKFQSTPDSLLPGDLPDPTDREYVASFNPLPTAYCRETKRSHIPCRMEKFQSTPDSLLPGDAAPCKSPGACVMT